MNPATAGSRRSTETGDRVDLKAVLQERETRLRLITEQLPVITWSTDPLLNVVWWSGERPTGTNEEPTGTNSKTMPEFFRQRDLSRSATDASLRALEGETVTFEHAWGPDRYRFSIESVVDEIGVAAGTVGVAVNLSQAGPPRRHPLESSFNDLDPTTVDRPPKEASKAIVVGDLWIDPEGYIVKKKGEEIPLTITEFRLLLEFARHPGRVLSQKVMAERVWGYDSIAGGHSNIPTAIKRLRTKIEDDPTDPHIIETVRGVGYRMRIPES